MSTQTAEKPRTVTAENLNRSLTPAEAIKATGCNLYGNIDYAKHFSKAEGDSEKLTFILIEKWLSPDAVDALVAAGGWKYASLHAVCKHNQDNPDFANDVPHFIQENDEKGRYCCVAFNHWRVGRSVYVYRLENDWDDRWFVAVVPVDTISLDKLEFEAKALVSLLSDRHIGLPTWNDALTQRLKKIRLMVNIALRD